MLSALFLPHWGLPGGAGATVLACAAATVSFSIGFTEFGLRLPVGHLVRIALATVAMAALLRSFPEARSIAVLGGACRGRRRRLFRSACPALRTNAAADAFNNQAISAHAPSIREA